MVHIHIEDFFVVREGSPLGADGIMVVWERLVAPLGVQLERPRPLVPRNLRLVQHFPLDCLHALFRDDCLCPARNPNQMPERPFHATARLIVTFDVEPPRIEGDSRIQAFQVHFRVRHKSAFKSLYVGAFQNKLADFSKICVHGKMIIQNGKKLNANDKLLQFITDFYSENSLVLYTTASFP